MIDVDKIFCDAILTEGLEKYDIVFDTIVKLYESEDCAGIERMIDLALGTEHRGYVRTTFIAVKPIRWCVSEEKYQRLLDFLK